MKYIKIILISIVMMFCLAGCTSSVAEVENRFIRIYSNDISVYYDKETKVEYAIKNNGHGGTSLTLLVDSEGKPLLYEGE